jgi:photosystem II stability/assembly factor-like uncharacterized protein
MNIQGRVTVDGLSFDGVGQFKFALLRGNATAVLWTHDGTSSGQGFQPTGFVTMPVTKGIYSVLLGDTTVPGMSNPINPAIFRNDDVRLRVWFNDGTHGFQQLVPDQRVGAVGYSYKADLADEAAVLTGNVPLQQLPSILITNNATAVNLTGEFTGDGSGLTGIRGSTPFQIANAQTNNAVANTGYIITNAIERVVLLPATDTLRVGDIVRVAGPGSWKIAQRANQSILATQFRGAVGATWTPRDVVRNWSAITSSTNFMNLAAVVYGRFVHISTNGGANWFAPALSPSKNWLSIAMSGDGQRLLAGPEGDFLFISPDFGQSWSGRSLPGNRVWSGVAMSDDGTNMVAVSTSGPLFTSHDGGEIWIQRNNALSRFWTAVAMSGDGSTIVAVSQTGMAISNDRGFNWSSPLNGSFTAVACSADGRKIAAALSNNIYTSDDGGASWTRRDAAGSKNWTSITCSADGSIIAATAPDGLSISVDGGGAWTVRATARDWQGITCSPDGLRFAAVAFNGFIYTSEARQLRATTTGITGYLAGGEYSAVELQHAGGGRFSTLSSSGQIFAY